MILWTSLILNAFVYAKKEMVGKFNLKSVDTEFCCLSEDLVISCENQCPPQYEKHFTIFKEDMKYTLLCPDRKSWVFLFTTELSGGRTWRCGKKEPAEFEIREVSQNIHQEKEYVILLADGTGACNVEPEFWREPGTKIECHKDLPDDHPETTYKFQFLDDFGQACKNCGEPEIVKPKGNSTSETTGEATSTTPEISTTTTAEKTCPPCECNSNEIASMMKNVIGYGKPQKEENPFKPKGPTAEESELSSAVEKFKSPSFFEIGFYFLLLTQFIWGFLFLRERRERKKWTGSFLLEEY